MNFEEQPKPPAEPAEEGIPPIEVESEQPIEKKELDPAMQEITRQVEEENKTIGPGIFSKLPEWLKKPIKVMMLAGTLGAGMGALSQAEAGGRYYTGRDVLDDGLRRVSQEAVTGITQDMQMGRQMRYQWEQQQMNLAVQEQQMRMNMAQQREQMAEQRQYQKELRSERKQERMEEMKLKAIEREARRYEKAIAKSSEKTFAAEEAKHNKIMAAIEKSYPSRIESQNRTTEDEAQYGQVRKVKGSGGSRSFAPTDREGL